MLSPTITLEDKIDELWHLADEYLKFLLAQFLGDEDYEICHAIKTVFVRCDEFELEDYSQDPNEELLLKHLQKKYPGANYQVAYEAGFSVFGIQRSLKSAGVSCIVVNPADVPSTDKDKKRKSDRIDARKIYRHLSNNLLRPIYLPSIRMEHARTLVSQCSRLVRDQTRCKNRIWGFLMFSGFKLKNG